MNLISIDSITVARSGRTLINNASFGIDGGDKIALIGTNGCGKSSLLRVLCGDEEAEEGQVSRNNSLYISRVDQQPSFREEETILDFIFRDPSPQMQLVRQYEKCNRLLESGSSDERLLEVFHELTDKMNTMACWELESRVKSLLAELSIRDLNLPMRSLSGGMVKEDGSGTGPLSGLLTSDPGRADQPSGYSYHRVASGLSEEVRKGLSPCHP